MKKYETYSYSKNGKEIDGSFMEVYRKIHKKGYPVFAAWASPLIPEKPSFIIITKDDVYLNYSKTKIIDIIKTYDRFSEAFEINFGGSFPGEILSEIDNELYSASSAALKRYFETGQISPNAYNYYVHLLGLDWEEIDEDEDEDEAEYPEERETEKIVFFFSKVFGPLFIDPNEDYLTIKAQKNMCKDAVPIKIIFRGITQKKYGYAQYMTIMEKCIKVLDKYDVIKKKGKKELVKSYNEKGQVTKKLHENLSKIENLINKCLTDEKYRIDLKHLSEVFKIKNIISSHEPGIHFFAENGKIVTTLVFGLSIYDSDHQIYMNDVYITFDENLEIVEIY
jgi:hypothetical protein